MTLHSWFIYLTLVLIATLTPGPAVLYIMTSSTAHGWRKSIYAALGNVAGLLCLGVMAVAGLGAVVKTSALAFSVIKYIGAGYLIYLGCRILFRKSSKVEMVETRLAHNDFSARRTFFQAFGVALSNPKAIVFLTALFPQFISLSQPLFAQFIILISTLMISSFIFLVLYAFITQNARDWINKPGKNRIFNLASGATFICFGFLLATSDR